MKEKMDKHCDKRNWDFLQNIFLKKGDNLYIGEKNEDYILFVFSGSVSINFNAFRNRVINGGEMVLLPKSEYYNGVVLDDVELFVLIYENSVDVYDKLMIGALNPYVEKNTYEFKGLKIKGVITNFIRTVFYYKNEGVPFSHLYDLKRAELTLLFRLYYTNEERAMFFYYVIGLSIDFKRKIMENYLHVKTAEELAEACGYEKSTFQRMFKKNFGQSPYKWMQLSISKHIYMKLINKEIPLKVIVDDFNFSSSGHLTTYCKRMFDATPIQIRSSSVIDDIQ